MKLDWWEQEGFVSLLGEDEVTLLGYYYGGSDGIRRIRSVSREAERELIEHLVEMSKAN